MRVRTGHNPNDWSENDPGAYARLGGHTGSYSGEFVQGESERDRQKRLAKASRAKPVDMNDYASRWDGKPRCDKWMRQAKQRCARTAGHRTECKTAEAMEYSRQMRQGVA